MRRLLAACVVLLAVDGCRGGPLGAEPVPDGARAGGSRMKLFLAALAALIVLGGSAAAQSIRHVYRTAPALVGLPGLAASGPYQNAADVILEQAIRNLPLHPAASSAYTYRWDAAQDRLVRVDDAVAAWPFTDRGQTLGEGLLSIGVTWGYYDVDSVNGHDLGHDPFPVSICCGSKIRYQAPTDLLYTVGTFNITYGLLDDLDLNLAIPIVTLDIPRHRRRPSRLPRRDVRCAGGGVAVVGAEPRRLQGAQQPGRAPRRLEPHRHARRDVLARHDDGGWRWPRPGDRAAADRTLLDCSTRPAGLAPTLGSANISLCLETGPACAFAWSLRTSRRWLRSSNGGHGGRQITQVERARSETETERQGRKRRRPEGEAGNA